MKNKFMTKALAVVLSASMALSLSSATALTANAAAAPKLAKKTLSVKAGKKAKNKLKAASYKAGWRITKATVKKTKVAKAKVKKNKKVVVVTGVQKGKSKVVVALKNAKTGAAKKIKFTVKVKVDKVTPEPTVETASFVSVKQTKHDTAEIVLNKELEAVPSGEVFRVYVDGADYALNSINFGADKKTLVVTYPFAESTDAKTYTYEFKTTDNSIAGSASFSTASYAVAKIVAEAEQTVQAGKLESVKFSLESAAGVDVTAAGDNLNFTNVVFDGQEVQVDLNAADPKVLLGAVGDTTKMTITYTKDTTVAPVEVKVTAVAATATEAVAYKYNKAKENAWLFSEELKGAEVYVDGEATINFWAKKDDKSSALGYSAVKYDQIDVTSADENVLMATGDDATGKSEKITLTGIKAGSTELNIKCTEYVADQTLEKTYKVPVTVKPKNNDLVAFSTSKSAITLTNALEDEYSESSDLLPVNSLDQIVEATFSVEVTTSMKNVTYPIVATVDSFSTWNQAKWAAPKVKIEAQGATPGSYTVTITADGTTSDGAQSVSKKRSISVKVTDVLKDVYTTDTKYKTELSLSKSTLSINDDGGDLSSDVTLAVKTSSSKFVGYARRWEDGYDVNGLPVYVWTVGTDYSTYGFTAEEIEKFTAEEIAALHIVAAESGNELALAKTAKLSDKELFFYVTNKNKKFVEAGKGGNIKLGTLSQADPKKSNSESGDTIVRQFPAVGKKTLFNLSIFDGAPSDVYVFANPAYNEGIAPAGSYTLSVYSNLMENATTKMTAATGAKSLTVAYNVTAPVITYDQKASGDKYADPSTWLLYEEDDKLAFALLPAGSKAGENGGYYNKIAAAKNAVKKANGTFDITKWLADTANTGYEKGTKMYAVAVPVKTNATVTDAPTRTVWYVVEGERVITD